ALEAQTAKAPLPQFRLAFADGYGYDASLSSRLQALDGVSFVEKREAVLASTMTSHVLFDPSDVKPGADLAKSGDKKAAHNVYYTACDKEIVESLSRYRVEGDPSAILTGEKQVILSDSFDNVSRFSLRPGDTIEIASFASKRYSATYYLESDEMLEFLLDANRYTYETYTVCAVIRDMPSDPNFTLYFGEDDFRSLTAVKDEDGNVTLGEIRYEEALIYTEEGLTKEELSALHQSILRLARSHYNVRSDEIAVSVTDLNADLNSRLAASDGNAAVFGAISLLTMVVTPIACFFSQTIFYGKRRQEFTLLRSMGAVSGEIRSHHAMEGGLFALSASILYLILTPILSVLLFRSFNASAGLSGMRVLFELPLPFFALGLVVTALSAFFSCYLPFLAFTRAEKRAETQPTEFL
ncbi:MAG: ABC transporter permease, partial [Oscillospiraceae bacterium]|nr:ABC transporter permease [Oscillospiraceae bacterium]